MSAITLSDEYQLVFPEEVREIIGLKVGTSFEVISYNNRIELVPTTTIYEAFKKLLLETSEDEALFAIAHLNQ